MESANIHTVINVPEDRWVLWADGPRRGPAVRFWGILVCAVLGALVLRRLPFSPLRTAEWILLAVGLTHLRRGNPSGATTLLRRGRARIARYAADPPYQVDIEGLLAWVDQRLTALGGGVQETDPAPPRLVAPDQPGP